MAQPPLPPGTPAARTPGPPPQPADSLPNNSDEDEDPIEAKRQRKARNRVRGVGEMVSTEATYVKNLGQIVEHYMKPLKEDSLLTEVQVETLFPPVIASIKHLNETLLENFRTAYSDWDNESSRLGKLFIDFAHFFRMYTGYVNNHERAATLLRHLNEESSSFVNYCQEKVPLCAGLDLSSLLITPIQRIPRYELLLRDFLKNTPQDHIDLADLQEAYKIVAEVNTQINARIDDHKRREKVRIIEEKLGGEIQLVDPARRLVKQGVFWKVRSRGVNRNDEYTFFLFSDMLLYASPNGTRFKLHNRLSVNNEFRIIDISETEVPNGFQIRAVEKSFIAFCDEPSDKAEWMQAFQDVMQHHQKRPTVPGRDGHKVSAAPIWDQDGASNHCTMPDCNTRFTWLVRRHHCRFCGALVCNECSKYRLPSVTKSTQRERACLQCYVEWKDKDHESTANEVGPSAASILRGPDDTSSTEQDMSGCQRCRALYEYNAEYQGDLSFQENDIIAVTNCSGEWWEGVLLDRDGISATENQGLFPSNYVEIIEIEENLEPEPGDLLVAICNYNRHTEEELSLRKGQRLVLKLKDGSGWWLASLERVPEVQGWLSPQLVKWGREVEGPNFESFSTHSNSSNEITPVSNVETAHPIVQEPAIETADIQDNRIPQLSDRSLASNNSSSYLPTPKNLKKRKSGLPVPKNRQSAVNLIRAAEVDELQQEIQPDFEEEPTPNPKPTANIVKPKPNKKSKLFRGGIPKENTENNNSAPAWTTRSTLRKTKSPATILDQEKRKSMGPPVNPIEKIKNSNKPVAKQSQPAPPPPAPVQAPAPVENSNGRATYSLESLQEFVRTKTCPDDVDRNALEDHLSPEDFNEHFEMSREDFRVLRSWKQAKAKQKVGLF